jgi:hypothetical protein
MWNFHSAAKWIYAVPFVNRFHFFEMPILGYAGYLPFGLECAIIGDIIVNSSGRDIPAEMMRNNVDLACCVRPRRTIASQNRRVPNNEQQNIEGDPS